MNKNKGPDPGYMAEYDQKPQEWTPEYVEKLCYSTIADAHNAALAAVKDSSTVWHIKESKDEEIRRLEQEQAMMFDAYDKAKKWRDEVKALVEALEQALSDIETSNAPISTCSKIRTVLAKVKEGKCSD